MLTYSLFKKGFLPDQGAVIDQANVTLELFSIFDAANAECDDILDARRRSKTPGPR